VLHCTTHTSTEYVITNVLFITYNGMYPLHMYYICVGLIVYNITKNPHPGKVCCVQCFPACTCILRNTGIYVVKHSKSVYILTSAQDVAVYNTTPRCYITECYTTYIGSAFIVVGVMPRNKFTGKVYSL
jgi:hypothetical protein